MKKITATIRLHKLDEVKLALVSIGVIGLTVAEIRQFSGARGQETTYRGNTFTADFTPRLKLEIVTDDAQVWAVIQALSTSASTGEVGDGKIFISPVLQIVRIRTGEMNTEAI